MKHMLVREHQLTLANTCIVERLNRMCDVHDGFGGNAIATLKNPQQSLKPAYTELHEDLRLFIDTTTHEQDATSPA